jgi:hypothetical protein
MIIVTQVTGQLGQKVVKQLLERVPPERNRRQRSRAREGAIDRRTLRPRARRRLRYTPRACAKPSRAPRGSLSFPLITPARSRAAILQKRRSGPRRALPAAASQIRSYWKSVIE